ncbi:MAG TPA: hydroxyisourate hydrolase [Burkholderiaceae bacterium]|nr:hydroxyisourate hydrolase [Burkholderiaceae bacterium]
MGKLSTHVLDTARGAPAAGVAVELLVADGDRWTSLRTTTTNADGRTDAPLLQGDAVRPGRYRLVFAAGDHFRRTGVAMPDPPFVDVVTIDFGIAEAGGHYHVPLLVSPWSWSTYRGS